MSEKLKASRVIVNLAEVEDRLAFLKHIINTAGDGANSVAHALALVSLPTMVEELKAARKICEHIRGQRPDPRCFGITHGLLAAWEAARGDPVYDQHKAHNEWVRGQR